jgi:hypothetical protein
MNTVKWALDSATSVGGATFYDSFNTQFYTSCRAAGTASMSWPVAVKHMKFFVN